MDTSGDPPTAHGLDADSCYVHVPQPGPDQWEHLLPAARGADSQLDTTTATRPVAPTPASEAAPEVTPQQTCKEDAVPHSRWGSDILSLVCALSIRNKR